MRRLIREIIDVRESGSLDILLERLAAVRAALPDPSEAVVQLRGDDIFGRMITVTYMRPATVEEMRLENYGRG